MRQNKVTTKQNDNEEEEDEKIRKISNFRLKIVEDNILYLFTVKIQ